VKTTFLSFFRSVYLILHKIKYDFTRDWYLNLFNLCLFRIPKIWKIALVRQLHKNGSKIDPTNDTDLSPIYAPFKKCLKDYFSMISPVSVMLAISMALKLFDMFKVDTFVVAFHHN